MYILVILTDLNLCLKDSGTNPNFSISGPEELKIGETGIWRVNISLFDASNQVVVDGYAPFNESNMVSICEIGVKEIGNYFFF